MKPASIAITGFGSVTPFGTHAGLIPPSQLDSLELSEITAWPAAGQTSTARRALLVPPFQPASVVPGLKTRRLDRLSAWALVASSLALRDSGIDLGDPAQVDRSRIAVVFATGSGCIELTEAFYQSAYKNGWAGTDPITFPETLANSPAGHVALFHDLRGPNITVSCKYFGGESAMLQAASLLRLDQADLVVVIAGDTIAQSMYEWYETARLLSPACFDNSPLAMATGYIPSEAVVAMVLEPDGRRAVHSHARLTGGRWAAAGAPFEGVRKLLDGTTPDLTFAAGAGIPCDPTPAEYAPSSILGPDAAVIPAQAVALGLPDTGAPLHLLLALSAKPAAGKALMLATSGTSGYASLLFDLS